MAIKLYQFAISHFCEKARWALDYKGLNYQTVTLLPGQHVAAIRKTGEKATSVPVLEHDGHYVQGSADIVSYLDETFAEHPLTPEDPEMKQAAIEWERRLDEELGPAVRCYCYHHLLQRPKVVVPLLTAGTPFYNKFLVKLAFSRVDELLRKYMKINEKTSERSRETMERYLDEMATIYQSSPYLVGDQFTRADLAAAAFFAPLFQPEQYPVPWPKPEKMPTAVKDWLADWQPKIQPLEKVYAANR